MGVLEERKPVQCKIEKGRFGYNAVSYVLDERGHERFSGSFFTGKLGYGTEMACAMELNGMMGGRV